MYMFHEVSGADYLICIFLFTFLYPLCLGKGKWVFMMSPEFLDVLHVSHVVMFILVICDSDLSAHLVISSLPFLLI